MRKYHPDSSADPNAHLRAQELNAAFAVLGNPTRRAAYDASRSTHQSSASTHPPDDHSPTPSQAMPRGFGFPINVTGTNAPWILGVVVVTILVIASAGTHREAQPISGFNNAAATGAASLSAGEPTSPNIPTATASNAASQDLPLSLAVQGPTTLRFPANPVDFEDVNGAAVKFDEVLNKRGIVGAREFSKTCHKNVIAKPTWSAADLCTAFDIGAAHFDAEMAKAANGAITQDKYFRFRDDNARDTYSQLGVDPFSVVDRIDNIRRSVGPIVDDVILARLNRDQSARNASSAERASGDNAVSSANQ